jgi:hypothetical protein
VPLFKTENTASTAKEILPSREAVEVGEIRPFVIHLYLIDFYPLFRIFIPPLNSLPPFSSNSFIHILIECEFA